jgi:SPP1 family predicted phage head-tail adaptor
MTLPRMPDAGAFDQRVQLQVQTVGQCADGTRTEPWADWGGLRWAQVLPTTGRDLIAAGTQQHEATVKVRIRWVDGVTGAMRLLWRGRVHQLVGDPIDITGGRHTLELLCKAGPDAS